jgi:hypothetical protein
VLEDWLLERDDPRAVIVQLEKRGKATGAMRVREQLYPQLLGPDHEAIVNHLYAARWRAGFLREVHFAGNTTDGLRLLGAAPAAKLMRALTISVPAPQTSEALAHATAFVHLRSLTISSAHVQPPIVSPKTLARFARLTHLGLRGAYTSSGEIPGVRSLVIAPTRHDLQQIPELVEKCRFPDVVELTFDLRNLSEPIRDEDALRTIAPKLATFNVQR